MDVIESHLTIMRAIYICHCRRKGLQNEFVSKNFLPAHENVFDAKIRKVTSLVGSIATTTGSALDAKLRLLDSLVRSLSGIYIDRVNSVRGLKKEEEKLVCTIAILRDASRLSSFLRLIQETLSTLGGKSTRYSWQTKIVLSFVNSLLDKTMPSKAKQLERFVEYAIVTSIKKELVARFKKSPDEFSLLKSSSPLMCPHSTDDSMKSESEIIVMLSKLSFERVADALQRALGPKSTELRSFSPLLGKVINSTLESFLDSIRESRLLIDEGGLYKLYRLILGIEELISKARSFTNFSAREVFLEDPVPWVHAQLLLDYLNSLVFDKLDPTENALVIDASQLEHREEWRQLVHHHKANFLQFLLRWFSTRKRLKGTVFVALKINDSLL